MAEATVRRSQKAWAAPASNRPELKLENSLTRTKVPFVPNEGNLVRFYICGPTVYDYSHMGHARAYLTFDIIRRVLTDYFKYDVQQVMNITDIDDKIIKRGRQRHLLKEYLATATKKSHKEIAEDLIKAIAIFKAKIDAETDSDKKTMLSGLLEKVMNASKNMEAVAATNDASKIDGGKTRLLADSQDVLMEWLDSEKGSTISEHHVFDSLSREFETEFLKDMGRLGVLPTDVLTRVSEYVPEIIAYVEKIIKNGYAYKTTDGSVYFDTAAFTANKEHFYAKLVPEAYGDSENLLKNMREGEGELSMGNSQLKKTDSDFALWKVSKPGEPSWDSPWGKGRPGWHIECSVMSNAVCGKKLDIHAGGFDLKFPHHDNEIAQVEAHYDDPHWVNYFLHCGTLRIAGLKMSKSLKNFITIRKALEDYTPRQIRTLFLMHNWSDTLDYSEETLKQALHYERVTNEFFLLVKDLMRKHWKADEAAGYAKYDKKELEVNEKFLKLREEVHAALCDSIDTRTALKSIRDMVDVGNAYITEKLNQNSVPNVLLLRQIALYITEIFKTFGMIPKSTEIGYPIESGDFGGSKEEVVMPYLDAMAKFREDVRTIAREHKVAGILKLCDELRDDVLPNLGVRLEDRNNQTTIKLVDREVLMKEREEQEKVEREKREKRIPPEQLFRTTEYSQWDEKGIPTHIANGEEVSKKLRKKLEKLWETQQKDFAGATQNGTAVH
ncbi:unnamed protein product, partial [Mesorhabditis spiculigera]